MSILNKMENPLLLSFPSKSKSVPSLLLSPSQSSQNKNKIKVSSSPYERLKSIEETINNKNTELIKIKYKLAEIKLKEKLIEKGKYETIEESLPFYKRQEILEDNKIKDKLNKQNISLNNKLKLLTEKVDKIEAELLYGSRQGFLASIKAKLKEALNKKEILLSKINENNNEINNINQKGIKNKYKFNKKIFLDNLDIHNINISNTNTINKSRNKNIKKNYLSENDIMNNNKEYNKDLYEEEKNRKIKEQIIKEEKYKQMREKEIATVQKRKKVRFHFMKDIMSRNWINNYSNNKKYLSWDLKEKERIKSEENLILLSNQKKNLLYQPISSEELNEFSNKVKKEEIKQKNNSINKKKMLEDLWKERKEMLPKHKSKFLMLNIQTDQKEKDDLILKKEKIKGNMFERLNFSSEVAKKFKPKLIDEKIKKERIKKIKELDGIDKQREIKELNNRLKLKLIKIVNTQPQNFRKNNIFETTKTVFEQQTLKLQTYKNLEISDILSNDKKNINSENTYNNKRKMNTNLNININNNNFWEQYNREKSFKRYVKEIKTKLRLLNQLVE